MVDIVFTGGGTAGHVTPNLALFPKLLDQGYSLAYLGQKNSIEQNLVEQAGIDFYSISAGKLRRYLDWQNLSDVFRILLGIAQALLHLLKLHPRLVFSKGGFVSCPVVWAAWLLRIPVIIHESDISPGLANKLSIPFAKSVCYSFPETAAFLPAHKRILTGVAIRDFLAQGEAQKGNQLCGFDNELPCIMIIGGSQGSHALNDIIRKNLPNLSQCYNICHLCGAGGLDNSLNEHSNYKQFEYVDQELPDLFAMADLVISRAGATSVFELLSLAKPNLLIPLPLTASRGDQILNAQSFERQGFSIVAKEENLKAHPEHLLAILEHCFQRVSQMHARMKESAQNNAKEKLISLIQSSI